MVEEIATVWASVGVGVSVHALSCFGLATRGTEEQRHQWLPDMLAGDLLGAYCLSEAHAGSDPSAMRTRARRDGDDYVINGAKTFISNGILCDLCIVAAKTEESPEDPHAALSLIVVEANRSGFIKSKKLKKLGQLAQDTAELMFEDWQSVMDSNVRCIWFMAKAVVTFWIENKVRGKVLLMSSVRVRHGNYSGYTG